MNQIYAWSSNFEEIQSLINELSKDEKFLIPQFLLRSQLIEFALKYLLVHAPYKPKNGIGKKEVEKMTVGGVISKLKECKDTHLDSIIESANKFKELRNEVTHRMINSDKSIVEIEALITEGLPVTVEIERGIIFFAEHLEKVLGVNFEEIKER
jgi:hypothetical protein